MAELLHQQGHHCEVVDIYKYQHTKCTPQLDHGLDHLGENPQAPSKVHVVSEPGVPNLAEPLEGVWVDGNGVVPLGQVKCNGPLSW